MHNFSIEVHNGDIRRAIKNPDTDFTMNWKVKSSVANLSNQSVNKLFQCLLKYQNIKFTIVDMEMAALF